MKTLHYVLLSAVSLALAGCSNVKTIKITADNQDKIFEQIKDSHDLTFEEAGLLQRRVIRSAMANAFGAKTSAMPLGETLGQIIDDEKKSIAEQKTQEQNQDVEAKRAQAADAAATKLMNDVLTVAVYEKGFHKASAEDGDFRDEITLKLVFKNNGTKAIRAFKGEVAFNDLFGESIKTVGLKEDESLAPNAERKVTRSVDFNQFMKEDTRLVTTKLSDMKPTWQPSTILFADGTEMSLKQ